MAGLQKDRDEISSVYGLQKLPHIANHRDASAWKKSPTTIVTPSNPKYATDLTNPYQFGNLTATQTVAPTRKRRKTEDTNPAPRRKVNRARVTTEKSGPSRPPLGPDVIVVSESDELLEMCGADEMNIMDGMNGADSPQPRVPDLKVHVPNPNPFRKPSSKRVSLPSGSSTQRLKGMQSQDSSDPIENADDMVQNGRVKQIVANIEKRPHIKDAMRPKEGGQAKARKPASLASSPCSYLPLREWVLGLKHICGEHHLSWSDGTILVRKGPPSKSCPPTIAIRTRDIDTVEYYDPSQIGEYPVVLMITTQSGPGGVPAEHADSFSLGEGAEGKIIWKFNVDGSGWSPTEYKTFIEWLKPRVKSNSVIRGSTSDVIWTAACQLASTRFPKGAKLQLLRDQKTSLKRSTPDSDGFLSSQTLRHAPVETRPFISLSEGSSSTQEPTQILRPIAPRSSVRQAEARRKPLPKADPDEVILVYPPGAPGAVNITNADLDRLQPGQYLNDTLIEFGLKHWLKELESSDPALAKQIHVFSSFFYKKLNKKNMEEGYESVQKWTAKFNIFDKKYIIVPINENVHWYLAIIYHPEHILRPPPPAISKRRETRQTAIEPITLGPAHFPEDFPLVAEPPIDPPNHDPNFQDPLDIEDAPLDLSKFAGSCSILVTKNESPTTPIENDFPDDANVHPFDFEMDTDQPARNLSPTISDLENISHPPAPIDVDADDTSSQDGRDMANVTQLVNEDTSDSPQDTYKPVASSEFYNKGKAKKIDKPPSMEIDDESDQVLIIPSELPDTYIFTLDSLGSGHTQAINQLSRYLKMEASSKLGLEDTGDPRGKKAMVPSQPNYCDCGLYLLHLAKTFMSDPAKYRDFITTPRKKPLSRDERMEIWKGESLPAMRDDLANNIRTLSAEWKKHKDSEKAKQREEGKIEVGIIDSSDDDVDIVDATPPHPSLTIPKTNGKGKAARLRGD